MSLASTQGGASALLSEKEIFDFLTTNFRQATTECELLASLPAQGQTYDRLRNRLREIENACRQAGHWREDTRWFPMGIMIERFHQIVGNAIRHHNPRWTYLKLAELLRACQLGTEELRDKATGHVGAILPDPLPQSGPHTDAGQVQVTLPKIIIPE